MFSCPVSFPFSRSNCKREENYHFQIHILSPKQIWNSESVRLVDSRQNRTNDIWKLGRRQQTQGRRHQISFSVANNSAPSYACLLALNLQHELLCQSLRRHRCLTPKMDLTIIRCTRIYSKSGSRRTVNLITSGTGRNLKPPVLFEPPFRLTEVLLHYTQAARWWSTWHMCLLMASNAQGLYNEVGYDPAAQEGCLMPPQVPPNRLEIYEQQLNRNLWTNRNKCGWFRPLWPVLGRHTSWWHDKGSIP